MQRRAAGAASAIIVVLALLALLVPSRPAKHPGHKASRSAAVAAAVGSVVRDVSSHNPVRSVPARLRAIATAVTPRHIVDKLPSGPGRCPDPRTCDLYSYLTAGAAPRWPTDHNGHGTIHYSINPAGTVTDLRTAQIVSAIGAAFATWHAALPGLTFVYDGTTTRTPQPGDAFNDIGFTQFTRSAELGNAVVRNDGSRIVEADMMLSVPQATLTLGAQTITGWSWTPCGGHDGSCTTIRHCDTHVLTIRKCYDDLQNVVTHEIGHWLWLGDLHDPNAKDATMYYATDLGSAKDPMDQREKATLSLGDVVGARKLYPCGCPLPTLYAP